MRIEHLEQRFNLSPVDNLNYAQNVIQQHMVLPDVETIFNTKKEIHETRRQGEYCSIQYGFNIKICYNTIHYLPLHR